jgi:hypothetical protein
MTFVVFLLASFVFTFVSLILTTGFVPAVGMSASILDASPQIFGSSGVSLFDRGPSFGGFGEGGSYLLAGSIGGGLLFALTMTLVFQVWLLGINMVYLKVTEGLDAAAAESALLSGLSESRRKAAEIGIKAMQATDKARTQAVQAVEKTKMASIKATSEAVAPTSGSGIDEIQRKDHSDSRHVVVTCPTCSAELTSEDRFCSSCGHRLVA